MSWRMQNALSLLAVALMILLNSLPEAWSGTPRPNAELARASSAETVAQR